MARVGGGHQPVLNEYTAMRKDGTRFPVMIRSTQILQDGKLCGLRGFIIDLTEKKKLENQILQSQKLESIGTLAGGIAHDFNNILSAVLGYADLSLTEVRPGDLLHGYLLKIRSAGERARDMVRQILTFSRKSDQEMVAVQIRPIVDEALKLIRATLPATIEIRSNLESRATVLADPTQIHQVLMNLCTNAGHAMADGGVLTVTLTEVARAPQDEADSSLVGPCVRLKVADTGCGMSEEVLKRIFDPFFTTKGADKGTGLGLAVVHGIVKSHGGSISVASSPGRGTVFTVHLPVLTIDSHRQTPEMTPLPHGTESILWVDDEDFQVELGVEILQRLGYRVEGKTRADEALELFRAEPQRFDLVMTDMTMPGMTGETLAREILALRLDIPVILCTGYNEQVTERQALAKGIAAFAYKPIEIKDLAHLVRRVLDKRRKENRPRREDA
jgi:signal transduction histidine kinase/ActR/RegA family two-component response regulator